MSHYVGLDVSVKSVSICVVDAQSTIIARGETTSDPDPTTSFTHKHAPDPERVVHESGILAIWRGQKQRLKAAKTGHRRPPRSASLKT